jgi:hypothetical protein
MVSRAIMVSRSGEMWCVHDARLVSLCVCLWLERMKHGSCKGKEKLIEIGNIGIDKQSHLHIKTPPTQARTTHRTTKMGHAHTQKVK